MPRKYQYDHELRHLVYFQAVARHLHYRQAAEDLGVAQPALSRQILQLENALGVKLFNRSRRRVEMTPAGAELRHRVEPLLQSLLRLPNELQAVAKGNSGCIRVAFTGLAMSTVLPGILRDFTRQHPHVSIELNESPTTLQLTALRQGEIDCGFFHPDAQKPKGLQTWLLLHERNGILLPSDNPLTHIKGLRLQDLVSTPFVLFPRAHNPGFYDRILATFSAVGVVPKIAEEVWPRANGIGLVRAGLGATFITPSEAQYLPREVVFRPLNGPTPESRLMLGWRKTAEASLAVQAFLSSAKTASEHSTHSYLDKEGSVDARS